MSRLSSAIRWLAIAGTVCTAAALAYPSAKFKSTSPVVSAREPDQRCFAANADIAGIGVRVSTYTQSFLLFFTTLLCVADGLLDSRERKALEKSYTHLLITACALLISAFVQAATSQLSIYHAFLVLYWSWMLTANALILSVLPTIDGQIEDEWQKWMWSSLPSRVGQIPAMLLVSFHLSLMGAFGVYVWWDPARLQGPPAPNIRGDASGCLHDIFARIFFARFRASNKGLRIVSLVSYSFIALPFFNVFVLTALAVFIVNFINFWIVASYTFGRLYRITWIVQTIMNLVIAINTELTISENTHLLDGTESTWGFGQILAVVLILSPVFEAFAVVKDKLHGRCKGTVEHWFQRILRKSEDPWEEIHADVRQRINNVIAKVPAAHEARCAVIKALASATGFLDAADTTIRRSQAVAAAAAGAAGAAAEQQEKQERRSRRRADFAGRINRASRVGDDPERGSFPVVGTSLENPRASVLGGPRLDIVPRRQSVLESDQGRSRRRFSRPRRTVRVSYVFCTITFTRYLYYYISRVFDHNAVSFRFARCVVSSALNVCLPAKKSGSPGQTCFWIYIGCLCINMPV